MLCSLNAGILPVRYLAHSKIHASNLKHSVAGAISKSMIGRTPACVKTCNSQDTMSATWRKERTQFKRMRLWKPPHTGLSHDADVSFCIFCLMSWCLSWRSWCAAALLDLREIRWGGTDWIRLPQGKDQWQAPVNMVMSYQIPRNIGKTIK
jgi:hypothetical protein